MDDERRRLEEKKRESVGALLFRAARRFNEYALGRLSARTGVQLRPSHTTLFARVDLEGTRPGVLAERLGISKQAVSKLVAELVASGVLECVEDPSDARATLVRFSKKKGQTLLAGIAFLREVEGALERELGAARSDELRSALRQIDAWLDREELSAHPSPRAVRTPKRRAARSPRR